MWVCQEVTSTDATAFPRADNSGGTTGTTTISCRLRGLMIVLVISLPSDTFGPEVSFVNEIRNETGSQNEIGIIKISKGGTSIRESRGEWHGNPNDNPGYLFDELIEEVDRALDALAARGDRGIIRGMIWHQGEADRSFRFYTANLDELIDAVRDEFGSNLPIVVGELSRDRSDNATFNANLDDFVDESSNLGLVSSSGLDTFDTTHFDADDTVVLGQRFARELGPMVGTISTPTPSEPGSPFIDLNGDFRDGLSGWTIEDLSLIHISEPTRPY